MEITHSNQDRLIVFIRQVVEQARKEAVFVAYGTTFDAQAQAAVIEQYIREPGNTVYLAVTPEQRAYATPEEALFLLIQQMINALIDATPDTENARLLSLFRALWNIQNQVRDLPQEEQRAEFVRFTKFVCCPVVQEIFQKKKQAIVLVFFHFEYVSKWGNTMYNFLLAPLLQALEEIPLRVVLFVNEPEKPDLFYGSSEESIKEKVLFCNL